jgi:predicted dithiol-disulfide oxidoreductase (DUF899 family)
MADHRIVPHDDWIAARKELLAKEKAFSRQRDELTALRSSLPWEPIEKTYVFDGPDGAETLADLFVGRSQLVVYHFMFDPDWNEGCKSCSLLADHYDPAVVHLQARDVTLVTVSRAPLPKLDAFKKRMGWTFKWVSSHGTDFNRDFDVTFTPEELEKGELTYNYRKTSFPVSEGPGISVFAKDGDAVFHTYSSYARGLDMFIGAYNLLDIVPKGRDEAALAYGMEWVRHHDRYEDSGFVDPYVEPLTKTRG